MTEQPTEHDDEQPKVLPNAFSDPTDAREQAADYLGFAASKIIHLPGGGEVEIPNPGLFDDEQQQRWDEMELLKEQCEKAPDTEVPETVITTPSGTVTTVPSRVVKGGYLVPLRIKNGDGVELFNLARRQAIAVLGEEGYARFKAAGGRANDVSAVLTVMQREFQERVKRDSKSDAGSVAVAPASDGDRS